MKNDRINFSIFEKSEVINKLSERIVDENNILTFTGDHFIAACYEWLFDREPDTNGLQSYRELLEKGISKKAIIYLMIISEEFNYRFPISHIEEYRREYLKCEWDVSFLLGIHDKGDFIEATYQMILKRKPDLEGFYHHLNSLLNGEAKESIIYILATSEEGRNSITVANLAFYQNIFQRYQKHRVLRKIKRILYRRQRIEVKINECYLAIALYKNMNS